MLDYLPRDLHLYILKRLPFNSIIRCSTVCKSWNSFITSTDFISAYQSFTKSINGNGPQTLLVRYFDQTNKVEKYLTGKDDETFGSKFSDIEFRHRTTAAAYFRVVGYCGGVFCLSDGLFDSKYMVILWNPSIRKSVRVLVPNHEQVWPQVTVLGFGVCPRTHDLKIVKIVCVNDFSVPHMVTIQDRSSVEVFSLASGGWRKQLGGGGNHGRRPHKMIQISWSQICFNGAIHWIACDKRTESDPRCLIVSFDLVREEFAEMPLPDALARERQVSKLSINNRKGCLTVIKCDLEKRNERCGIWVMREYGVTRSWEKRCIIHAHGFLRRVVGFRMNGEMVLALKNYGMVWVEGKWKVKRLDLYGNLRSFFIGSFMESLILADKQDGQLYQPC